MSSGKMYVIADLHNRKEQPYFTINKNLLEHISNQEWNNENNYFLQLGDFFHTSEPEPDVIGMCNNYLNNRFKFKQTYILAGNLAHEYNRRRNVYAIDSLSGNDKIAIIKSPQVVKNGRLSMLLLPWIYDKHEILEGQTLKAYYEALQDDGYDFIFGHFSNIEFFNEVVINLDHFKGKKILGHIHTRMNDFLGVPHIEKGQTGIIKEIDLDTGEVVNIELPDFVKYETVNYPNKPLTDNTNIPVFIDVENAKGSEKEVISYYQSLGYYVKKVTFLEELNKNKKDGTITEANNKSKTLIEHFEDFSKKEKLSKKVNNKIFELLRLHN